MTPERWERIDQLFHAALARGPAERADLLARECGGDEPLRQEIESLLSSHERSDSFIETPASDVAAAMFAAGVSGLKAGQTLGHFRVVRRLASGGMGDVYLADDTRLGRRVALKLLQPHLTSDDRRVRRFRQEAEAVLKLNHPNIVTVHDVDTADGQHFIASEFVEGETLRQRLARGPLPAAEAVEIAAQIADALSAAHEAGVVHRDVKPENVMIRSRDGYVKVLDFGLAKLAPSRTLAVGPRGKAQPSVETNPGIVMGTVRYMSPEQACGEDVDERTDVWSLGAVLYEALAGRAPFVGKTPSHVVVSIMEDEPPPLARGADVPAELERIVAKALAKDRRGRYQTAGEMALALQNLKEELGVEARLRRRPPPDASGEEPAARSGVYGAAKVAREPAARTARVAPARVTASVEHLVGKVKRHRTLAAAASLVLLAGAIGLAYLATDRGAADSAARGKKSIAVLPLKPIDAANRDEMYEIGIADSLIHRLGSMKGLIVRPLGATRKYADVEQDPIAAGKEQRVDYVLASNYQLAGGKIRITAQLVNVASGQIEETYKSEKDASDVFALQDAVAAEVGSELLTQFATTAGGPVAKRGTTHEEAYRLYLQGMYLYGKRTQRASRQAIELLDQAVRLDPNYALAWAGKAHAHRYAGNLGRDTNTHEEYRQSVEAINRALSLDKDLSEAYSALCENRYYYEFDFAGAEADCKRAVALDPNSSLAHEIYGRYLYHRGRFDEGIGEIKTAVDLEPTSLFNQRNLGIALYYAGRYEEAEAQFKRVIAMDETFTSAYMWLRNALEMQGDYAEAFEWLMKAQRVSGADEATIRLYERAYRASGYQGVLREHARFHEAYNQYYVSAILNAQVGNRDKAFEYLERSY